MISQPAPPSPVLRARVEVASAAEPRAEVANQAQSSLAFFALPAVIWSRILVLFGALSLVKLLLLAGLSKHLFEMHWRIADLPVTWVSNFAFYLFVVVGVLTLGALGRQCRAIGLNSVRIANAIVLVLGLLFIFLSFHAGDKNYLYPVMTGVLKWNSLWPYVSLDLFFRPPFLAGWLCAYAIIYYILSRTGREIWVLHLTAICAGAFALISLRELRFYRNELLVADCLGLACLVAIAFRACPNTSTARNFVANLAGNFVEVDGTSRKVHDKVSDKVPEVDVLGHASIRHESFRLTLLFLPVGWAVLFWELFSWTAPPLTHLDPYFRLLFGGTIVLFIGATCLAWRRGFLLPWLAFVPFLFCAFLLLGSTNYPSAKNYNNVLCLALQFPRYFMEELGLATGAMLCAAIVARVSPNTRFWGLDILNLALISFALIDLRLSQIMGVRLGWDLLTFGDSPVMMWRMAKPYLPSASAALLATALLYFLGVRLVQGWFKIRQTEVVQAAGSSSAWFLGLTSFVLFGVLGLAVAVPDKAEGEALVRLVRSSPLWSRLSNRTMSREELFRTAKSLGLGDLGSSPASAPAEKPRDLNVLLVFMESSYNKHLSLFGGDEETQPLLSKYKERMEIFPNFFSTFAGSIHARFSTFTSLYPVRDYNSFTLQRIKVKSLFEVLHDQGYHCSLFYSSFFDYTGFGDFLKGRGIDEMYDANSMPGRSAATQVAWGLREDATLKAIRERIAQYAKADHRFFLTYVPAAPHYPYDQIPKEFCKFKKTTMGDYTPVYLNELLYMDWILASIIDQLKESSLLDKTLVIITNDHGEMLGEEGHTIGHGWAFTPELANTPLLIMDPQNPGCHVNYTIGCQVDLLPTVLDRLRLPQPSGQVYEGYSLDAKTRAKDRRIYMNTMQQFGVLEGDQIFVGDRQSSADLSPGSKGGSFKVSNQGTKTVFTEDFSAARGISINAFDGFQENFLRNYDQYALLVAGRR